MDTNYTITAVEYLKSGGVSRISIDRGYDYNCNLTGDCRITRAAPQISEITMSGLNIKSQTVDGNDVIDTTKKIKRGHLYVSIPNIKHTVKINNGMDTYLQGNIKKIICMAPTYNTTCSASTYDPVVVNSLVLNIPSNAEVPELVYVISNDGETLIENTSADMCEYIRAFSKYSKIYVPNQLVDKFKNSDGWFMFSRNIFPMSQRRILDTNKQYGIESDVPYEFYNDLNPS